MQSGSPPSAPQGPWTHIRPYKSKLPMHSSLGYHPPHHCIPTYAHPPHYPAHLAYQRRSSGTSASTKYSVGTGNIQGGWQHMNHPYCHATYTTRSLSPYAAEFNPGHKKGIPYSHGYQLPDNALKTGRSNESMHRIQNQDAAGSERIASIKENSHECTPYISGLINPEFVGHTCGTKKSPQDPRHQVTSQQYTYPTLGSYGYLGHHNQASQCSTPSKESAETIHHKSGDEHAQSEVHSEAQTVESLENPLHPSQLVGGPQEVVHKEYTRRSKYCPMISSHVQTPLETTTEKVRYNSSSCNFEAEFENSDDGKPFQDIQEEVQAQRMKRNIYCSFGLPYGICEHCPICNSYQQTVIILVCVSDSSNQPRQS